MANMANFRKFTTKWKDFVTSNKIPTEQDWDLFFAQSNPVAGINWGTLSDTYTDRNKEKHQVNERTTIKNNWSEIRKKFNELYNLDSQDLESIKQKLKEIKSYILDLIKDNGGREQEVATNRILVTLYPDKLLSIPGIDDVIKLADILTIVTTNKDWIDICFEVKPELEKKYPNIMHWDAYRKLVMENNLTKKYNLILTGAPGTGKTFMAKQMAVNMTRNNTTSHGKVQADFNELKKQGFVDFVQFHPSYDYTDFVEGLRPSVNTNSFVRTNGIFKDFCAKAVIDSNSNNKYVFIIDEINRGEISKIFGELFFSIDPDYRGTEGSVETQYQNLINPNGNDIFKSGFYVPKNVYIIGTMNDIDRSVESMDFAFRRRFTFYEITAQDSKSMLWDAGNYNSTVLENAMDRINNELIKPEYGLSEAYQIGASYFNKIKRSNCAKNYDYKNELEDLWEYQIKGLLFEYLRGKPNASVLLKQLKKAYNSKEKPDVEDDETQG